MEPIVNEFGEAMVATRVVCHTAGCGNDGVAIVMYLTEESPVAGCGVCGNRITDIEAVQS